MWVRPPRIQARRLQQITRKQWGTSPDHGQVRLSLISQPLQSNASHCMEMLNGEAATHCRVQARSDTPSRVSGRSVRVDLTGRRKLNILLRLWSGSASTRWLGRNIQFWTGAVLPMMLRTFLFSVFLALIGCAGRASAADANASRNPEYCYQPCMVTLHGTTRVTWTYGPPNFGDPKTDKKIKIFVLVSI